MIKTIQIVRWAVIGRHLDNNMPFIEDLIFETKEEAKKYLEMINKSKLHEGICIQPVWTHVNIEIRGNALFIEDDTIIFQKEK